MAVPKAGPNTPRMEDFIRIRRENEKLIKRPWEYGDDLIKTL